MTDTNDNNNNNDAENDSDIQLAVKFETKKLYFFAGPHKCASTSVERFFAKWAADGAHEGHGKFAALQYWRWPTFDESEGEKEYSALVKRNDDVGYEKLALDTISQKFEESDNGVFLGTEEFDQVGPDKYYDALPIMQTIADKLEMGNPQDVKVVMNYRTPRLDQWVSVWKHADKHFKDSSYAYFMCQADQKEKDKKLRKSMIGAEMNPLGAAKIFLEQGWSVTLMDMGGVSKAGHHIVHAIGCQVLKGGCKDGYLGALRDYIPKKNAVDRDFVGLNFQESKKAEKLFRYRDCAYQKILEPYLQSGQLEILYQDTLWASCNAPQSYYDQYIDNSELMYNALLSQVKCIDDPDDIVLSEKMDAVLDGGDVVVAANNKKSSIGGGGFHISFFDMVLIVALVTAVFQLVRQRMGGSSSSSGGGGGSSPWGQLVRKQMGQDTEMAPYPRRGYRDDDKSNDGGGGNVMGGYRDDTSLDEEEVSDEPSLQPPRSGGSVGSHSLSGRI